MTGSVQGKTSQENDDELAMLNGAQAKPAQVPRGRTVINVNYIYIRTKSHTTLEVLLGIKVS